MRNASCDRRGQSKEMEPLLVKAREDGAEALVLLGDLGAEGEGHEYAGILRTVGRAKIPAFYVPGPGDAPGRPTTPRSSFLPCMVYTAPSPWLRDSSCSSPAWEAR